jgi:hypothetical protein
MGTTVLDPGPSRSANQHLYAHCLRNQPGGIALLAINADKDAEQTLHLPLGAERYSLTAANLTDSTVDLNGKRLELGRGDALPGLRGAAVHSGTVTLAPASITFLAFPRAGNAGCK